MLAAQFFVWWYGEGWRGQARLGRKRVQQTVRTFSAPLLISTMFSPWRRILSAPGPSLQAKLEAIGDNLVSRAIGFTVRLLVLITAAVMILLISLISVIQIVSWPLVPPLILFGIVKGII
jgi:hypothetical protein